jgi:hypothetical protein
MISSESSPRLPCGPSNTPSTFSPRRRGQLEDLLADEGGLLRLQPLEQAVKLRMPFLRDAHPFTIASRCLPVADRRRGTSSSRAVRVVRRRGTHRGTRMVFALVALCVERQGVCDRRWWSGGGDLPVLRPWQWLGRPGTQ